MLGYSRLWVMLFHTSYVCLSVCCISLCLYDCLCLYVTISCLSIICLSVCYFCLSVFVCLSACLSIICVSAFLALYFLFNCLSAVRCNPDSSAVLYYVRSFIRLFSSLQTQGNKTLPFQRHLLQNLLLHVNYPLLLILIFLPLIMLLNYFYLLVFHHIIYQVFLFSSYPRVV